MPSALTQDLQIHLNKQVNCKYGLWKQCGSTLCCIIAPNCSLSWWQEAYTSHPLSCDLPCPCRQAWPCDLPLASAIQVEVIYVNPGEPLRAVSRFDLLSCSSSSSRTEGPRQGCSCSLDPGRKETPGSQPTCNVSDNSCFGL